MAETVHIRAHAKLNLALSVGTPIPADQPGAGLHPIASWMAPIEFADELAYTPRPDGEGVDLDRSWADDAPRTTSMAWLPETDLCARAVDRIGARVGRELGATIQLRKRVPVGGGLGGGSADAAATLIAANRAHDLGLSLVDLAEIGAGLGSDVPYFIDEFAAEGLAPAPALVTGLGDRIERVASTPVAVVLCVPGFGCDTGEVYRALDEAPVTLDEAAVARMARAGDPGSAELFNDLFEPARRVEPALGEVRRQVGRACGRPVHLSGSGSTLFLIADDADHAASLVELLTLHVRGVAFVASATQDPSS